jgi:hypothetical protein
MGSTASTGVGWVRRFPLALALAMLGSSAVALTADAQPAPAGVLDAQDLADLGLVDDAEPLQAGNCGGPGLPPCPLQAWMRATIAAPLAGNNTGALAVGLERAAALQPDPGWASWRTIALQGAAAAKKGDVAGARAACKGCHDAWREAYKRQYRGRIVPR